MQLVFDFSQWLISPRQGVVGRQYDNLSHSLVVEGELPSGYTWDMLVEARGKYNVIPLTSTETGASAPLTDDQLAFGDTYYAFQLRGVQGDLIHHTNAVQVYVPETIVGPGTWPVLPTEFSQAEANIREFNAHPPVPGENGYWMLWDLDTHSYVQSQLVVPGLHIEIGETTTGEPGTPASVTNSGTDTAPVLDFTIPEGEKGDAATIQVGEVTASDPGSDPKVTNSGTANAAVFDFVLPRGQTGPTGQAATIEVASTVTGEPGTQASVENVGTTAAAKLKFTIPKGDTGQNGVTPTLAAGDVETLEPDQPATASVTGEGPAYQINLGIPRGQTGAQGAPGQDGQDGQDGQTPTIAVGTVTTLDPGQDATAEITGETPNLVLSLGIPQGQPGKDGVQINDEAVNTTETWSSKKLLDTLCPPFSVSGNPVVCHPVEGYPLGVAVTMEPIQAGEGDPSPENVRPISGWDEVTVNVRGKNLLDYSGEIIIPQDIYQYVYSGEEFITALNKLPRNTPLVMSANWSFVSESATYKRISVVYDDTTYSSFNDGVSATIEDKEIIITWLYSGSDKTQDCIVSSIQFEAGSTPTPYEPYQGTTSTLTIPETIYGGTVDAVNGEGSKEWYNAVFTGGENWVTWGYNLVDGVTGVYLYFDGNYPQSVYPEISYCPILPYNHLAHSSDTGQRIASVSNQYFVLSFPTEFFTGVTSTEEVLPYWKSYLKTQYEAGTPVTICYKLATPEPFQATGNQALPAVAGLNTVYTDGDSLAVSGRQDLLYTLQNMQAQTQNLNRFIAEGGTQ